MRKIGSNHTNNQGITHDKCSTGHRNAADDGYVLVDDWYQTEGRRRQVGKAGAKPRLSESEVLTLALAEEYLPCGSKGHYVA